MNSYLDFASQIVKNSPDFFLLPKWWAQCEGHGSQYMCGKEAARFWDMGCDLWPPLPSELQLLFHL